MVTRFAQWTLDVRDVERMAAFWSVALGATHADVGQHGDEGFTVLADPEGNEFCLLHRP
jgi:predicted enzyme related to lactoylglutathione lyase